MFCSDEQQRLIFAPPRGSRGLPFALPVRPGAARKRDSVAGRYAVPTGCSDIPSLARLADVALIRPADALKSCASLVTSRSMSCRAATRCRAAAPISANFPGGVSRQACMASTSASTSPAGTSQPLGPGFDEFGNTGDEGADHRAPREPLLPSKQPVAPRRSSEGPVRGRHGFARRRRH